MCCSIHAYDIHPKEIGGMNPEVVANKSSECVVAAASIESVPFDIQQKGKRL
jgi:hypothetical protein